MLKFKVLTNRGRWHALLWKRTFGNLYFSLITIQKSVPSVIDFNKDVVGIVH